MNRQISNPLSSFQTDLQGNLDKTLKSMTQYLIELQGVERDLYNSLRNNPEMDNSEKESIVNKINLLSDKRESLNSEIKSLGQQA